MRASVILMSIDKDSNVCLALCRSASISTLSGRLKVVSRALKRLYHDHMESVIPAQLYMVQVNA